jgi:hypothetical protein
MVWIRSIDCLIKSAASTLEYSTGSVVVTIDALVEVVEKTVVAVETADNELVVDVSTVQDTVKSKIIHTIDRESPFFTGGLLLGNEWNIVHFYYKRIDI